MKYAEIKKRCRKQPEIFPEMGFLVDSDRLCRRADRRRIWSGDQEGSGIFWKLSLAFISAAGVRMPDRVAVPDVS